MSDPTLRAVQFDDKDVAERDDLFFVVRGLRPGETFGAGDAVITVEPRFGVDASPDAMRDGTVELGSFEGAPALIQRIKGGVAGVVYLVRCTLTLSSGRILVGAVLLRVRRLGT